MRQYHTEFLHLERAKPTQARLELEKLHSQLPSHIWYTQSTRITWTDKLRTYVRSRQRSGLTFEAIATELNSFYSTQFFTRNSIAQAIHTKLKNGRGE